MGEVPRLDFRSTFSGIEQKICMAKTQYSFSGDMNLISAPENFEITVRNLKVSAGAGFIVALAGDIMTMPGLPKRPTHLDNFSAIWSAVADIRPRAWMVIQPVFSWPG